MKSFWDIFIILEFIRNPKGMMKFCVVVVLGAVFLAAFLDTLKNGISIDGDDIPVIIAVSIVMILGLVLITPKKKKANNNKDLKNK
ncbi:MAG: hypothetical protein LBK94_01410 [Prevotellaceae bacterium]|jgi:hypothetical protein|nr:hypothetical protein [Prevotellaceae bacterium]